eukprot:2784948-Rhodomonas_salina.1
MKRASVILWENPLLASIEPAFLYVGIASPGRVAIDAAIYQRSYLHAVRVLSGASIYCALLCIQRCYLYAMPLYLLCDAAYYATLHTAMRHDLLMLTTFLFRGTGPACASENSSTKMPVLSATCLRARFLVRGTELAYAERDVKSNQYRFNHDVPVPTPLPPTRISSTSYSYLGKVNEEDNTISFITPKFQVQNLLFAYESAISCPVHAYASPSRACPVQTALSACDREVKSAYHSMVQSLSPYAYPATARCTALEPWYYLWRCRLNSVYDRTSSGRYRGSPTLGVPWYQGVGRSVQYALCSYASANNP